MIVQPSDVFAKLEFNKVLQYISQYAMGEQGKGRILSSEVFTDKDIITHKLQQINDWLQRLKTQDAPPLSQYEDIEEDLYLLGKDGYVLEIESIQKIQRIILLAYDLYIYFQDYAKQKESKYLYEVCEAINIPVSLSKEIHRVLDDEGQIRPDASENLLKISKQIAGKEKEIERVFKTEVERLNKSGLLTENLESMRNGRRVLTVSAENKRKIPGIIHDESSTGKMIYIEPESNVALNNELFSLQSERRAEIYRILRDLCHYIRPHRHDIQHASHTLVRLDEIRAKAHFAKKINAEMPHVVSSPKIALKQAYNPLLFLKLEEEGKPIVSFDLELYPPNRIFVLSGPNAGGKSVTMKTVGLLQLMVQAGILVSAHTDSKFGIFEKLFVDIGDQQSLEDDLSTYSSHLYNMRKLLELSDKETLFLIDEFGSGTDPKIGGSIAEAILHQVNQSGAFGVVTTHYSNLKFYAFKMKGLVNGSMEFDNAALQPTYQLQVGKPGSSFAFEIAHKIGLPEKVIENARKRTGKNENAIEEMLVKLQAEQQEVEKKMSILLEKEENVDKILSNNTSLHKELEYQRKKLKLEKKEAQLFAQANQCKEIQKLIKELKSEKDLEKAEALLASQKDEQKVLINTVTNLKEEVFEKVKAYEGDITVDGFAKIRNTETVGKIVEIDKDKAKLEVGIIKMFVDIKDLIPAKEPIEINRKKSVDTSRVSGMGQYIETKLDLRGYSKDDALWFLEEFIERGLMNNAFELKIIHGIGNGTMRKLVQKKLREYKDIKEVWHPEEEFGGQGVTLVKL